ncbi:MAG: hypothetical protein OMM_07285 [Candidatus Magnetoglobus multicellularis str. Araruama]|uniref:Uncharacterized protein n=1 Tax=Candidatus Magnetoglobus multicellularis str. Araruama TaxID=890399 RepID=A0A1V1PDP0_9BACT|nr:MAG: hypothetical protein OMM_07285 [Candidatus Magnetoglobus multicellularis str. Araruama]
MNRDESNKNLEQNIKDMHDAEKSMLNSLQKTGKLFIPIKDMVRSIPQDLRNRLDIKVSAPIKKLRQQLERLVGQKLKVYPVKKATYIGKNMLPEELIVKTIHDHPDISLKLICQKVPLTLQHSIDTINELVSAGIVLPRLNDKMNTFFTLKDPSFAQKKTSAPK